MEGAPFKSEDDSEKTESSNKKKKAETFGSFLADPKKESAPAEQTDESKNFLEKLFQGDNEPTATEKAEAELPIDETTAVEEQVITEHLTAAQPELVAETDEMSTIEEAEAIETFRDKIVSEHKDADTALIETLEELAIDEPVELAETTPNEDLPIETSAELPLSKGDEHIIHLANQPEAAPEKEKAATGGDRQTPPPRQPVAGGANFGPVGGGNLRPNILAVPAAAVAGAAIRPEYITVDNESDVAGMALLGGIVGYLIGRRRGRIKTEKGLRPVQKKLEKHVAELQKDLIAKETRIRRVVRQQVRQNEQLTKLERSDRQLRYRILKAERAARRAVAPEASHLHGAAASPEHLGKVIIGAEALTAAGQPRAEARPVSRRIENLSHDELLATSQNIAVEHSNLRQIYETHLVSEQGLRRLVETYERGGDLKRALRREITEHDIDFERDPIFRDRRYREPVAANTTVTSINALVAHATSADRAHAQDEAAVLQARVVYETTQHAREQSRRQMVDIGLVGTIMILAASVIILLLTRG